MIFWHPHHINIYKPGKDLRSLFVSSVIRQSSIGLIALFSSLYIYSVVVANGYESKIGVIAILLFHCLIYLTKVFTFFIAENYTLLRGFKSAIVFSLIPFFFFITTLILVEKYILMLFVSGIFWGIHAGFYWWGYHGYFIKSAENNAYGKSIGEMDFLKTVTAISIPVGGSIIAENFGYIYVFLVSCLLMVISVIVLKGKNEKRQKKDTNPSQLIKAINNNRSVFMSYVSMGVEGGFYTSVWPLFLYLFFKNVLEMGSIISVAIALAAFFAILVGGIEDKKGEKTLIGIGTPMLASSWLIRTFLSGPFTYVFSDSLWNFGQKLVYVPLDALSYKKSLNGNTAKAILFREIGLNLGAFSGFIILAIIFYMTENFYILFFLVGVVSFIPAITLALGSFDDKK